MKVVLSSLLLLIAGLTVSAGEPPAKLNILYLGDTGHHQPLARFAQLQPVMAERGITLTYSDQVTDLNPATLNKYDGLMVYANTTQISPEQEKALLDYVASGKGFIPLHCASYCFLNSPKYIELVGAQFRSHTTGVFRTVTATPDHPIMIGCSSFESWDETYVHTKHNEKHRTVLEYRVERGDVKEPWTWVRTHGKGRVFYTAWGHDQRTWSHPGFHTLVERGTRWACGQDNLGTVYVDAPKMTPITGDKKDFESVPAKVPFYSPTRGGSAEPIATMQKPLTAEKSMKHYTTPVGFELKLFATDADFQGGKPMAMTWDERGRLWVTVTTDYPNELQRPGEGRDKIMIFEDTDGDGKADKFTVFADKLSIPTSIICAHGGVIIHQAPYTLFLKDTDGDGKADVKQILMSGWATNDTHAGPSNLRYGFDNWYYGSVGYAGFSGTINGERFNFRQGYYRFKVEPAKDATDGPLKVTKLEFMRSTSNNTWGFAFNEEGQMFGSTANGCVLVHLPIPNRYYEKVRGLTSSVLPLIAMDNRFHPVTEKIRQVDWHGGFTSAANCAIYTARTYPPEYWNKTAFVSDPTGHLTATFNLQPTGADYVARYGWNLVAADDEWAAPIDAQVGPDGNMWVLDWYNFIVQHNPTPRGFTNGKGNAYETDLRDKKHGRIYRVVYTGAKPEKTPDLSKASPEQLVQTLNNPNMLWRAHAQRLLLERNNADVVPSLKKLTSLPAVIHAAWTVSTLTQNQAATATLSKSPSPAVRRVYVQTLPKSPESVAAILESNLLNDRDESVRLAALLALSEQPTSDAVGTELLKQLTALNALTNKTMTDGVTIAAATHGEKVLLALKNQTGNWSPVAVAALERVAETYATKAPATVCDVLALALDRGAAMNAVVAGITKGWPNGKPLEVTADSEKKLADVLTKIPATSRGKLLKLASTWGMKGLDAQLAELSKGLLATVTNAKANDEDRVEAARQVIDLRSTDDGVATQLLKSLNTQSSPQLANGVLEALGGSSANALGGLVVAKLKDLPPSARPTAMRLVLGRPASAKAFLDAVEAGQLRFDMLALDQKTSLANHPDQTIAERAKKILALGGGLPDANRQKVIDEHHVVLAKTGDVANGKKLFTTHCAKCHKHGNEGQVIGPDLTGFAVHPKDEILIAVLDPSRSVEGNYKSFTVKTLDGKVVTGLLAAESKTTVEVLDAENKRHTITRDNIDELSESTKSLMPEGFEKQMKPDEIGDLLEFLTQKGKYVPIPLDKVATIVSTKGMFFDENGMTERMIFRDWSPKTFEGVPFILTDPQGNKVKNVVMLNGPQGNVPPTMPKSVMVPCNAKSSAIHMLSGVGGWNWPVGNRGTVSMIVRLHYADGKTEDHPLLNGVHFADYISRTDVPGSKFAFALRNQQLRYLTVTPKRTDTIRSIELVKGRDASAPIVMAITVETP